VKNLDSSVPAHPQGREGNLLVGTQIRSLKVPSALDGAPDVPAASPPPPCVASSIALVALGGSDPVGGFCLRTLSNGRPTTIL
jgi:hypothetical protein